MIENTSIRTTITALITSLHSYVEIADTPRSSRAHQITDKGQS